MNRKEKNDLEKGLIELFKHAFITNCHLDNDTVTTEDTETIDKFDTIDLLENFKDLILNLLNFKKDSKINGAFEISKGENIEDILKNHENEVKYHVKLESELKSQLENAKKQEEKLLIKYEKAIEKIQSLEKIKIDQKSENSLLKWEEIKQQFQEKIKNLNDKIDIKEKYMKRLETENSKLKNLLEEKFIEIEVLKKNIEKLGKGQKKKNPEPKIVVISDSNKKNICEKTDIAQKPKEKISNKSPLRELNREKRKSCNDPDLSKLTSVITKGHNRSLSENKFFL